MNRARAAGRTGILALAGLAWQGGVALAEAPVGAALARVGRGNPAWIEAEAAGQSPGKGQGWTLQADPLASAGQAMLSATGVAAAAGQLGFPVTFAEPGRYRILLRAKATGQIVAGDTVRVGFNGQPLGSAREVGASELGYRWLGADRLAVQVSAAGVYRIDVWARSPGYALDALYVTDDLDLRPGAGQATSAGRFWHSVGVNTHIGWYDSAYADLARVEGALGYLGVRNLRDAINSPLDGPRFDRLGQLGYRFALFVGAYDKPNFAWKMQQIIQRAAFLDMVEGPNETDLWPVKHAGQTGPRATRMMMRDIRAALRANPASRAVPLAQTSVAEDATFARLGDLGRYVDRATIHSYFPYGDPPGPSINQRVRAAQRTTPGKPVVATETGYYTALGGWGEVPEAVQAKYLPRILLEHFSRGIDRIYIYELMEPWPQPKAVDQSFGLFRPDGTPKPAATAVRNLLRLVRDSPPANFRPGRLDYRLRGMPPTAGDLLLQRGDGTFLLVLWNDAKLWNSTQGVAVPAPDASVVVELDQSPGRVVLHDTFTGTASPRPASDRIRLTLPGHAVVLELSPPTGQ